ncbi:type IA DNA topoisomerase [Amycolatopsis sp. CA-230715]|uniref:type IA DNA topoisomerase n=1 Tax=Amycolatopsis sp. CA-230715 TaxID=2745196 RepID=UPI001C012D62|nr:DNA topoisomerase [Amycolatopsis sp. CA-230715]QWF85920.1 DNA topoisomerase 1 [Amycolatopsis sp. CA-230715]
MVVGILTEKPSAARHLATALGGMSGTYNGERFVITQARGHLYEFADPHMMVRNPGLVEKYRKWDLDNLPWDPGDLDWTLDIIPDAAPVAQEVKRTLSGCDEIVIGTDVDPTGEGGMIAVNAALELGLKPTRWSRMYFTDEAATSLRTAFTNRRPVPSLTDFDEYKKARYRSQFDLLSMQFTRIATAMARSCGQDTVLRQGRLKSAMVTLVGDQLKAYNDYVKKPFFQNRFRDENDVLYTNPDEPRFDRKDQVPRHYEPSAVVLDSTTTKRTAPPKLLDLAALSALLVGKNIKAKLVLATYQKMYEDQIVSYPRTEDKTITPEQFDELAPLVDQIATVAGVDTTLLTHRGPRSTHVKPEGAHGANRPGPNVPDSLDALEQQYGAAGRVIYETLAKNYLAMIAEDYVYEQQKGHVGKYPAFLGIANVPRYLGWKQVFDPDLGDDAAEGDEYESATGLGTRAEPIIFEGANKRPEHPSMRWLMKQLEKRDVGTGATRTSTYSDVTSTTAKHPLLVEKRRKLLLAPAGEMSWHLLPGTRIGDLSLTEKVYADMREIAAGTATAEECLDVVADWVLEDIATMRQNAATMRSALGLPENATTGGAARRERAEGVWAKTGRPVAFSRVWGGHRFTDDEVTTLLAGATIEFSATADNGRRYEVFGALGEGTFKGRTYVGFQKAGFGRRDASGAALPPTEWCAHVFTDAEIQALMAGQAVEASDFRGKNDKTFQCKVYFAEEKKGQGKKIVPDFDASMDSPPKTWCQVRFTDDQLAALAAGKTIQGTGFVSKHGKTFDAALTWKEKDGRKKLVPSFDRQPGPAKRRFPH